MYFYIFSRSTLNETFMAKYDGVLPRTPSVSPNPKFTPLRETTTFPTPFIGWEQYGTVYCESIEATEEKLDI